LVSFAFGAAGKLMANQGKENNAMICQGGSRHQ
jgi:hypothetical protein